MSGGQARDAVILHRFRTATRELIRALVDPVLIEEHRVHPLGQHSPALERVLDHLRRAGTPGKVVVVAVEHHASYRLARLGGRRGAGLTFIDGKPEPTIVAALHTAFLLRLREEGLLSDVRP